MRDKYNLNTLPMGISEDMLEYGEDCHHHLAFVILFHV